MVKYFLNSAPIAINLHWPKSVWSLLLQCKLIVKANEVCSTLSLEKSLDHEVVKTTVLRAYELVPEAYKFRKHTKTHNHTFVDVARCSVLCD